MGTVGRLQIPRTGVRGKGPPIARGPVCGSTGDLVLSVTSSNYTGEVFPSSGVGGGVTVTNLPAAMMLRLHSSHL